MKKFFTLVAAAMLSAGAFAQYATQTSDFAGVTREVSENEELLMPQLGEIVINNTEAVETSYLVGTAVEYAEGMKTDVYVDGKKTCAEEVFFPSVADASADRYFGVSLTPKDGKTLTLKSVDLSLASGNAFKYKVEVSNASEVLYTTADIKVNNYNNATKYYANEVVVSTEGVSGLTQTAFDMIDSWGMDPTTTAFGATAPLPSIDFDGVLYVKVYFWDKNGKSLTFRHLKANVYDPTTTAISNVAVSAQKVTKSLVNGKIVIANGANTYNVAGQLVK